MNKLLPPHLYNRATDIENQFQAGLITPADVVWRMIAIWTEWGVWKQSGGIPAAEQPKHQNDCPNCSCNDTEQNDLSQCMCACHG